MFNAFLRWLADKLQALANPTWALEREALLKEVAAERRQAEQNALSFNRMRNLYQRTELERDLLRMKITDLDKQLQTRERQLNHLRDEFEKQKLQIAAAADSTVLRADL